MNNSGMTTSEKIDQDYFGLREYLRSIGFNLDDVTEEPAHVSVDVSSDIAEILVGQNVSRVGNDTWLVDAINSNKINCTFKVHGEWKNEVDEYFITITKF